MLTDARYRALYWYEQARDTYPRPIIAADCGWTMRQTDWLLERGFLYVGPGGWHVPTEAGRRALAEQAGGENA